LGAASCKKDDKKSDTNSWTVGDKTYHKQTATVSINGYAFADPSGASVNFIFKSLPIASGTFKVSEDAFVGPDEVGVMTLESDPMCMGVTKAGTVTVTVDGAKVSFKCSGINLERSDASGNSVGDKILSADVTY
jgi:hypothetical protein